jgi:outer membrane protein OmpA-like peptidoglycan-associated protein
MKTVLVTLAFVAASLSLISVATPDLTGSGQPATAADAQAEHQTSDAPPTQQPDQAGNLPVPATHLAAELEQLRAALDSNREELQWVHELLQQAGETLYWAQTRHQQSAIMQHNLEDQLIAVTAADEARQAQVTQLASELNAIKASLSATNRPGSDFLAQLQALEDERDQLRDALTSRDQQLAMMEKKLQTARADLQQAQTLAASQAAAGNDKRYQACQTQQAALTEKLTSLRLSETDARQSLVTANSARYRLQTELAACSENLIQAKANFASMEVSAAPAKTETAAAASADSPKDSPVSLQGVKFRYDSADLTDESRAILDRVAATLRKQTAHTQLEIAGHTDSQGDPAYNLRLSQQRAETVMKYLISRGVDARQLKARGYGGVQPIADNSTWAGLVSNRRVELREIH